MKILAVDTSGKVSSVAVMSDGVLLGEYYIDSNLTHSQTIMDMIVSCLKSLRIDICDIDIFAVSKGPGSFTGLRIGISIIKGLAMANNKPCIAVSTLEGLAYNFMGYPGIICPVMDARREQVYTAVFRSDNNSITQEEEDTACLISDLGYILDKAYNYEVTEEPIIFVGDGSELCYNTMEKCNFNMIGYNIANANNRYQRASSIAYIANMRCDNLLSASELQPSYLRIPQAERERKEKLNNK